jgi:excisionase family DNA binding protein
MALIAQLANTEPGATAPVAPLPAEAGAEDMLTTFEAAARLNISRPTVSMLCNQGKLGGVIKTEGGHRRIPASAIEAYKASRLARS